MLSDPRYLVVFYSSFTVHSLPTTLTTTWHMQRTDQFPKGRPRVVLFGLHRNVESDSAQAQPFFFLLLLLVFRS